MKKKQIILPWKNEVEFYELHSKDIFSNVLFYHQAVIGENGKEFLKYIIAKARITQTSDIVDLGCGSGYLVGKLNGFCRAIGISTSKECIKQAKINFPTAHFEVANMENYSKKDASHFVSLESLGYSDIERTFNNAYENLKNGGIFYIKDDIQKFVEKQEERENREYFQYYWKYNLTTLPELIKIAGNCGFRLLEYSDISGRTSNSMYLQAAKYHKVDFELPHPKISFLIMGEFLFIKN